MLRIFSDFCESCVVDVVRSPAPPSLGTPPVPKLSGFQKLVDLLGVCLKRVVLWFV